MDNRSEKPKVPEAKHPEKRRRGGHGKTARALLAAALISGAPGVAKGTPFEELAPKPHPFLTPTLVEPQNYGEAETQERASMPEMIPEEVEAKQEPEIQRMQKSMVVVSEHIPNPSFKMQLEKEGKGDVLDLLEKAVPYFDRLSYVEKGGDTIIRQNPKTPVPELPDNLKIVIRNGKIVEVNGKTIGDFDDWKTIVRKSKEFMKERRRSVMEMDYEMPKEDEQYSEAILFGIDKKLVELLSVLKPLNAYRTQELANRSRDNSADRPRLLIGMIDQGDMIILVFTTTISEGVYTVATFTPDGRAVVEKNGKYEYVDKDPLFEGMYKAKQEGGGFELTPLPEPVLSDEMPQAPVVAPTSPHQVSSPVAPVVRRGARAPVPVVPPPAVATPEVKKGLRQTLAEDPKIVEGFMDNPDSLMAYLPHSNINQIQNSRKLVDFIKENKNQAWAREGFDKLKNDIRRPGGFSVPTASFGGIKGFYEKYFPDMPYTTMGELGLIVLPFFD